MKLMKEDERKSFVRLCVAQLEECWSGVRVCGIRSPCKIAMFVDILVPRTFPTPWRMDFAVAAIYIRSSSHPKPKKPKITIVLFSIFCALTPYATTFTFLI